MLPQGGGDPDGQEEGHKWSPQTDRTEKRIQDQERKERRERENEQQDRRKKQSDD